MRTQEAGEEWGLRSVAGCPWSRGFLGVPFWGLLSLQLWTFLHLPSDLPVARIRNNKIRESKARALGQLTLWGQGGFMTMGKAQILGHKETFPTGLLARCFQKQSQGADLHEETCLAHRPAAPGVDSVPDAYAQSDFALQDSQSWDATKTHFVPFLLCCAPTLRRVRGT